MISIGLITYDFGCSIKYLSYRLYTNSNVSMPVLKNLVLCKKFNCSKWFLISAKQINLWSATKMRPWLSPDCSENSFDIE